MAMEVGYLRHSTTITNGLCCNCDPKPRGARRVQTRLPGTLCLVKDTFTSSKAKLKKPSQREIFLTSRKRLNQIQAVSTAEKEREADKTSTPPIPSSIHDISNGDHILGFGADLTEDHPGYHDLEYKRRRSRIADLAKIHKIGEPIPCVDYTSEEIRVWGHVLDTLVDLYPTHACKEYLNCYELFNFKPNYIPQLQELSEVLERSTGWHIRPVAGLLHPRDFLNGLAFRTFHSTQYVRHGSNPMYTPEPDICHEVLGHVPILADPEFADLAWAIGQASLGASEKDIWHLTKLYWYTVEFGTVKEGNEIKAFGAGLLSSFGELKHMRVGTDGFMPEFVELDPFKKMPKMSYKDGYQKRYFLCESFADAAAKLRAYSRSILKPEVQSIKFGDTPIRL
ncbi:phenylalanine 4-monooxygenase, chloroplastic isoform X1 [Physcomitrium patens]|uniref:Phenylalanine 4-monooxygenase, chloroplastic n=1 Tax=Physcomitrium patens TaxID=3218 RepID=PH4H_PHYPA|nr:phenylalanine 4-monooxygenase, chloroplastic [Physcomitrium patens]XP_024383161.1 tryptophan 5-hydroxylase 1-like [Physcomitrium patens]XP_024383162.1 tryptophan 5-hydroxylase 1-like [Physcomitrium patens]XP_024383163.1 tryptophan 5-hydroxylase 1-like [Physcomitrium patens]E5KBU4.1 RecName: Full=Phenylalanine 4-monooxygenase, chloroplastic; AltName: Full=Aromatic amino acid hydroxylase; AltName: Full=Phenylalanine 4-hydroxylase; Flags: Precursor [Physcomitrium patens]ADR30400.1 chloroplast |eukprot:XP_024383161.1 tryptophan 5-hydroxylase 1-like [Physcomitrella patens]